MSRQKVEAELVQAKVDYIANVPGAWERYQFWQDEFVRMIVLGERTVTAKEGK